MEFWFHILPFGGNQTLPVDAVCESSLGHVCGEVDMICCSLVPGFWPGHLNVASAVALCIEWVVRLLLGWSCSPGCSNTHLDLLERKRQFNMPCAAASDLFSFFISTQMHLSHVYSGNSHHALLEQGIYWKTLKWFRISQGSMQTRTAVPIISFLCTTYLHPIIVSVMSHIPSDFF